MGLGSDILRGLNVFSGSKRNSVPTPRGAITLEEYQTALGLHESIKRLLQEKERSERRMASYAGVQLAKSQRPEKIDEILERDNMVPRYKRLRNKWLNSSRETQQKLITATGTRPIWERERLKLY